MHIARIVVEAVALITAMVLAERWGRRQPVGAVILALLSVVWLGADKEWEAGVLVRLSDAHGLTTSDLLGLLGLGRATWLLVAHRRRRRQR